MMRRETGWCPRTNSDLDGATDLDDAVQPELYRVQFNKAPRLPPELLTSREVRRNTSLVQYCLLRTMERINNSVGDVLSEAGPSCRNHQLQNPRVP